MTRDDILQILKRIDNIYCALDIDNVSHDPINKQENLIRSLPKHYDILRESYGEYKAVNNEDIGFQTEIEELLRLMKLVFDPNNREISNVSRIT